MVFHSEIMVPGGSIMVELVGQLKVTEDLQENWNRWYQKFTNYLIASEKHKKPDIIKTATLLHLIGDDGLDIYNQFKWDSIADKNNFQLVVDKFNQYCSGMQNVLYERCRFFKYKRQKGQSVDSYVSELKSIAVSCEFDNQDEKLIRDQLVLSVEDESLQETIFSEGILSLKKVMEFIKTAEACKEQLNSVQQSIQITGVCRLIKEEIIESDDVVRIKPIVLEKNEEIDIESDCINDGMTDSLECNSVFPTVYEDSGFIDSSRTSSVSNYIDSRKIKKSNKFYCYYCVYKTSSRTELKKHIILRHMWSKASVDVTIEGKSIDNNLDKCDEKNYLVCKFCNYSASNSYLLGLHSRIHVGEKPYFCKVCDYRAARRSTLESHLLRHSNNKLRYLICGECPFKTTIELELKSHIIRRHSAKKDIKCDYCSYVTHTDYFLKKHLKTSHSLLKLEDSTDIQARVRKYKRKTIFSKKSKKRKDKVYKCSKCSYSAAQGYTLRKHIMRMHTGERPFTCDQCDYRTVTGYHLRRHFNNVHQKAEDVDYGDIDLTNFLSVQLFETNA